MKKHCQNPLCHNEALKELAVSVRNPSDQKRALCAACEEAYSWGVQHGRFSPLGFTIDPAPGDDKPQPMYRVVYVIDVSAPNPQKAAESAYQIIMDPSSMKPVLQVLDSKGRSVRMDLSEVKSRKAGLHDETV